MVFLSLVSETILAHAESAGPLSSEAVLDLYTNKGGFGANMPGGSFDIGNRIFLYANVTYNGWPVQSIMVSYEALDPNDAVRLIRIAYTNGSGIAQINFTLPSPSGTWTAVATAYVGGIDVMDEVTFQVNPPLSVTISPSSWILDVGQSENFWAGASGGSGTYSSFQWYMDEQLQSDQNSTFAYSSSAGSQGTYSINVMVTDSFDITSPLSSPATVMVNAALIAPTLTPSASTVDQGQTSLLSNSTVISTGTSPYTYQWLEETPNAGVYSGIAGATLTSHTFATSGAAALGVWHFELNVTDATGAMVTTKAIAVQVNSALVAPSLTASPSTVDQGQTSLLSNSTVISTGTSPYTYQWFEKPPSGGYAKVGANSTSFAFVTNSSTATGTWSFILGVTDNTGTAVNSTGVAVLVNSILAAPAVTPSPPMIYQSQTSVLSNSTVINGGTPSYSYRWLEEPPGASTYYAISGATLTTYSFITSTSTTIGVWHFKLCVTDATGAVVTSNIITVTVSTRPRLSMP
jgi:hypothetical protein